MNDDALEDETVVLDASAFIAYLRSEQGTALVREQLLAGALISIVNWTEVLTKIAEFGGDPRREAVNLAEAGILGVALSVIAVSDEDAFRIAELRQVTRSAGLSLGDRACIALGLRLGKPVMTAERSWANLSLGVDMRLIR